MLRLSLLFLALVAAASAAHDSPWFLGLDGGVYLDSGGRIQRVGLGSGSSLAVFGQTAYLIGLDQCVWTADPAGDWRQLDSIGRGRKVVVDSEGTVYLLGLDGGVYQFTGGGWKRLGLATAADLAAGGPGQLFVIGTDGHVWSSPGQGKWSVYNALALGKRVAAARDGTVYVIGTDNGVYRVGSGQIQRLGLATGQDVAVGTAGQVGIVGMDNGVYIYDGSGWRRLGSGMAKQVAWPQ
ncbi:MAG: hypothetical protein HY319_00585 [Armatimonadetes bacterium]|nr:hypothetical protein [Armatimonadota bacterium]